MITIEEYFGNKFKHPDATEERKINAVKLIYCANALIEDAEAHGIKCGTDPDTGTQISGSRGGNGDGGFRLSTATTGRPGSAHKEGMGVDIYDPDNKLDDWITNPILDKHGLYRESPDATPGWSHVQTRSSRSGARTYNP